MANDKVKTIEELETRVIELIDNYGIGEARANDIKAFLIDDMHLFNIIPMARELPESEVTF